MNAHRHPKPPRDYAGKVPIRHALEVARDFGIDIAGFEISPDGTIRVLDARAMPAKQPLSDFDRLEAEL